MNEKKEYLKNIIREEVITTKKDRRIVISETEDGAWMFDFRKIIMKTEAADIIATLFWEKFRSQFPFQVGGLETASIPIITAIVLKGKEYGLNVNGFYIRKQRKQKGLQNVIEGSFSNEPVILVDDLINSGGTFTRQIKIVEENNRKVSGIFVIVDFNNTDFAMLGGGNIPIHTLFTLEDFGLSVTKKPSELHTETFEIRYRFRADNPSFFHLVPKSAPVVDKSYIYFGTDQGIFYALRQKDGSILWKYKVGKHPKGKGIFSTPVLDNTRVYFGAYDGNVYALDKKTGLPCWIFWDADWVGSSPILDAKHKTIFIGLEFGLFGKRGGLAALETKTGKLKWSNRFKDFTHSSPAYTHAKELVGVGGNDGRIRVLSAQDGNLLWEYGTNGAIKNRPAFSANGQYTVFTSFDGFLYVCNTNDGTLVFSYEIGGAAWSDPVIDDDLLFVALGDKFIYCLQISTKSVLWKKNLYSKIIATPVIVKNHLYIGASDGRFYKINKNNGLEVAATNVSEHITNKIAYSENHRDVFLPTYANEIYCLRERKI